MTKQNQEWVKEFEKEFADILPWSTSENFYKMESFIRKLIKSETDRAYAAGRMEERAEKDWANHERNNPNGLGSWGH
jgi:hypothetical protein